eukprot:363063-Chlamydomonas_euryale.AAC.2
MQLHANLHDGAAAAPTCVRGRTRRLQRAAASAADATEAPPLASMPHLGGLSGADCRVVGWTGLAASGYNVAAEGSSCERRQPLHLHCDAGRLTSAERRRQGTPGPSAGRPDVCARCDVHTTPAHQRASTGRSIASRELLRIACGRAEETDIDGGGANHVELQLGA